MVPTNSPGRPEEKSRGSLASSTTLPVRRSDSDGADDVLGGRTEDRQHDQVGELSSLGEGADPDLEALGDAPLLQLGRIS